MKQKLVALLLITVMVASVCGAVSLTTATKVDALTTTKLSLTASKATPLVGQRFTVTAQLKRWNPTTRSYVPLAGKPVAIVHYYKGVRYNDVTNKLTDSAGKVSVSVVCGSTGVRYWYATFAGNSQYAKSQAGPVTVSVRISTTLYVWTPPVYNPAWLSDPTHSPVKQGGYAGVRYAVKGADGKNPCGVAKYYIDSSLAGGTWMVTPRSPYWQGCPAGLPGGAGGLILYPEDTMELSLGWHTLRIHYLGDNTYAPCDFVGSFLVVAS